MWSWHDSPDGWGVVWMVLMMSVVWIPLILIFSWGVRGVADLNRHSRSTPPANTAPDAREIARQTYARGEIDRERFLEIIEDLRASGG